MDKVGALVLWLLLFCSYHRHIQSSKSDTKCKENCFGEYEFTFMQEKNTNCKDKRHN